MAHKPEIGSPITLFAFLAAAAIGGTNFIAVKFSNDELQPLTGAALRFIAAAALLSLVVLIRRYPLPRGRALRGVVIYGALGFGLSYAFLYYAVLGLGAGTTSVFAAAVPLVTLLLAVLHRQERLTGRGIVGGILAIVGIAILSIGSLRDDLEMSYVAAVLLGVVCVSESGVVIKGFPRVHPASTNAIAMATGALCLVVGAWIFDQAWALPETARTWAALLWLILPGSLGLFSLFLFVIRRWSASATSYILTLMPVVAVALGAVVADEEITLELVIGGVLVISAVYIAALSPPKAPPSVGGEAVAGAAAVPSEGL